MQCKAFKPVYDWWPLKGPIDVTVTNRLLDDDGVVFSLSGVETSVEPLYFDA